MKSTARIQKCLHLSLDGDRALGRRDVLGDQLQDRGLAGAVPADDPQPLPLRELQIDVADRPERWYRGFLTDGSPRASLRFAVRDEKILYIFPTSVELDRMLRHSR